LLATLSLHQAAEVDKGNTLLYSRITASIEVQTRVEDRLCAEEVHPLQI
jgi:hypothetical protein